MKRFTESILENDREIIEDTLQEIVDLGVKLKFGEEGTNISQVVYINYDNIDSIDKVYLIMEKFGSVLRTLKNRGWMCDTQEFCYSGGLKGKRLLNGEMQIVPSLYDFDHEIKLYGWISLCKII